MIELGQKSKPQKTPEPKINNDNREVHDTAEVVAERPEVSSPSQFDASHMLVSGGKLRRPFIVDAFENVQTDLGTLPPPPLPRPFLHISMDSNVSSSSSSPSLSCVTA